MQPKPGLFLHATPILDDDFFAGAVIYLTECNASGAMGFIINRPFGRSLHELEEFRHSRPFALSDGGPADREHLFFLHCRPDLVAGGTPVDDTVYVGGDFQQVRNGINNGRLSAAELKIFVGYCGWHAGELEVELAEGSWELKSEETNIVFGTMQ